MPITRRHFALSVCGLPLTLPSPSFARVSAGEGPWAGPAVVAKVYLAAAETHWPRTKLDLKQAAAEVEAKLAEVERKHAGVIRFTGGKTLMTAAEVEPWARSLGEVDAVLIVPLSTPSVGVAPVVDAAGAPCLCFSRPFAGHHWSGIAALRKQGRRVELLASSTYGDLDPYVPIFRAIHHLRKSKILISARSFDPYKQLMDGFHKQFGTSAAFLSYQDLKEAWARADERLAKTQAEEFARGALRIVEPKPREIHDALRFYLAAHDLLAHEKANAITIDCFPGLLGKQLPAYPCVAFSKLNDEGLYGVCESDLRSTMTQIMVTSYSGVPGFVANPVFDPGRHEVAFSHCVAATKMKGINGPSFPYLLRDHQETDEGVAMQVIMPVRETITVGKFEDARRFLLATAEVTGTTAEVSGTPDAEVGCHSKIRTRVPNAQKWAENYTGGLHRVIFYGNHVAAIERMGRMLGFEVIREA
jgi:hypothetical protein